MDTEYFEKSWIERNIWFVLITAALFVFEWTMNPLLSGLVICLKFGLADFLTGLWLFYRDDKLTRGFSLLLMYFALASARVMKYAILLAFFVTTLALYLEEVEQLLGGFGIAFVMGVLMTVLFGIFGMCTAVYNQVPLWIDSRISASRRENLWPPEDFHRNQFNNVLNLSLSFTGIFLIGAVQFMGIFILAKLFQMRQGFGPFLAMIFMFSVGIIPLAILAWRDYFKREVDAAEPELCWPELESTEQAIELAERWSKPEAVFTAESADGTVIDIVVHRILHEPHAGWPRANSYYYTSVEGHDVQQEADEYIVPALGSKRYRKRVT